MISDGHCPFSIWHYAKRSEYEQYDATDEEMARFVRRLKLTHDRVEVIDGHKTKVIAWRKG